MKEKILISIPFAIAFILLSCLLFPMAAHSYDHKAQRTEAAYYESCEDEYQSEIREVLSSHGITNCGINFTKVMDMDNTRNYNCIIYDESFSYRSDESMEEIQDELGSLAFACQFDLIGTGRNMK